VIAGTVRFFKPDKGYGTITSADLPDGFDAWLRFSAIEMDGYRFLEEEAAEAAPRSLVSTLISVLAGAVR
jgi:cold shock CspA family protein